MHIDLAAAFAGGTTTRRNMLVGAAGMAGAFAVPKRVQGALSPPSTSIIDWDDPGENLRILSRMWGSIEPGKLAFMYVFGPMLGTTAPGEYTPLFRMESIAAVRTYPQPGGAYRYLAGQFILFTDFRTGEILDRWVNPYLDGQAVDVFHYRDYPLDYTLDPAELPARYTVGAKDNLARKLVLDWNLRGPNAYGDAIAKTRLKNRLDPAVWKRESVGDYWETFEAYRWQGRIAEIEDRSLPKVPSFTGDFQTFKPWEPFMLMGQRTGKIFSIRSAQPLETFDIVPRRVMAYAERHFAELLTIPERFDGAYKLNDAWFQASRRPMP